MNVQKYIDHINANRETIKITPIAKYIGMDLGNFSKAINGKNMANGKPQVIPLRCLPKLEEYFKSKNIKIK